MTAGRAAGLVGLILTHGCATTNATRAPLVSDRPDFTESTVTMEPGAVQLEGGHTFERITSSKVNTTGELLLRVGVASWAELRLEPGSYTKVTSPSGDVSGREDGGIGVKVRFYTPPDETRSFVPAIALVLDSSVPTGTNQFRQNRAQPEAKLATAWSLTDRLDLSTNFNVARPRDENGRYTELAASASFGFEVTPRVGAYAELYGFAPQFKGAEHTKYANTGFTLGVTPNVQLDLRGGVGLNGDAPDYFVGAGFVRRW